MTSRKRGRQFAVQILYQKQLSEYELEQVYELFWQGTKSDDGTRNFAELLVEGILSNAAQLDMEINAYLKNWSLERIAIMDHLILRLGFFELLFREEVPWKVVVDEAVTLATMFSSEKSATFINGVLHAWSSRHRKEEPISQPEEDQEQDDQDESVSSDQYQDDENPETVPEN